MRILLVLLLCSLFAIPHYAQSPLNKYALLSPAAGQKTVISILETAKLPFQVVADDRIWIPITQGDTLQIQRSNIQLLQAAHELGYYNANLEAMVLDTIPVFVLGLGSPFQWLSLKWDAEIHKKLIDQAGISNMKYISGKVFRPIEVARLEQRLQSYLENSGYPFAAVWLDSIVVNEEGKVSAQMKMKKGDMFRIKQIQNKGTAKLPKRYIHRLIGISPNALYSFDQISRINQKIANVPFLQMTASPELTFYQNAANIYLNINHKKANRFDFIIGLLPQSAANGVTSKLLLTGTLNAAFYNVLNQGEHLLIDIQRLRPETQRLDIKAHLPFLFSLPIGLDAGLNIYKRDSTFLETSMELGVRYNLNRNIYTKLVWRNKSSSLLQVDTAQIKAFKRLPTNADFAQNYYGVETVYEKLDFPLNPTKGWYMSGKVAAGTSRIFRNNQIENISDDVNPYFKYATLYDTLGSQANRINLECNVVRYQSISRLSTLKLAFRAGALVSNERIFNNEFFRLGGFRTIRGFDEEVFFARKYALATMEYRLLLGRISYLSVFGDYAVLDAFASESFSTLYPLGLGAGLNLETTAGVFGISVAIGKTNIQPFDGRALKFHLGYVSVF